MVLQRTGNDLGRARAEAIHDDDEGNVGVAILGGGAEQVVLLVQPGTRFHHGLAALQEEIRDIDSRRQQAAGIPPQVQDQSAGPFVDEAVQRRNELLLRLAAEAAQRHVADIVIQDEALGLRHLDDVAHDANRERKIHAHARDRDVDRGPLLAPQRVHGLVHRPALGGFALDLDDAVADLESLAEGR